MARLVEGILRTPSNQPVVGATIKFIASIFTINGVPIGASTEFVTTGTGSYSISILEGSYHVYYKLAGHNLFSHLTDAYLTYDPNNPGVPIGSPITLEEIFGQTLPDTPVYAGCVAVPTPTAFIATSGFTSVLLSWAGGIYTCGSVTEIYTSATNVFADKVLFDTTEAMVYNHNLGHGGTVYYWIRFRNLNGDVGNWFSSGTGLAGTTALDPGAVLDELQQNVYDSAIFNTLRTGINSSFYQSSAPTTKVNGDALISGDTYVNTVTKQRYVWDTSQVPPAWLAVTDKETTDALTRLTGTEAVADGEIRFFTGGTEPAYANSSFGDIWIDTSQTYPLTELAIERFEGTNKTSAGTLSWTSSPLSAIGLAYVQALNTDSELVLLQNTYDTFVNTTLPADLNLIQNQIDGSITTWFKSGVPSLTVPPVAGNTPSSEDWNTNAIKNLHLGDVYYDEVSGFAYRFAYEDLVGDSPDAGVIYSWILIGDEGISAALLNASIAQDTADGKRRVFVNASPSTPTPPYDVGDLWSEGTTKVLKRCKIYKPGSDPAIANYNVYEAADWELATNYITTFYQACTRVSGSCTTAPTGSVGDMWIVTDEDGELRRYNGSSWILLTVATLAKVDEKIIEQVGYCEFTDTSVTPNVTELYLAHTTQSACESATHNHGTFAWNSTGVIGAAIQTVSTTVDGHTTTIGVNATSIDGLEAEYSVKIDTNGTVSGFGLSSSDSVCWVNGIINTTITQASCTGPGKVWAESSSTFLVAASSFAITSPTNKDANGNLNTPTTPFVVRTGDANGSCYVNGVEDPLLNETACGTTVGGSWVPAGVGIVGIQGDLVLDGTLNANKIVAGTITGDYIAGTTITGNHIVANTIDASRIVISSVSAAIGESDNLLHTGRFVNSSISEWKAPTGLTAPVFYDASNDGQTFTGAVKSSIKDIYEGDEYFPVSSNETLFVSGWIRTEFSNHDCRIGLNFKDDNNAANETWAGVLHKLALPFGERMVVNDISIALNSLIDGSPNPGELVITSTHLITPNGENVVTTSPVILHSPYGEGEAGTYYIMYTAESRATRFSGLNNPGTSTQFVNIRYDDTAATWQAFGNLLDGTVIDFIPLFDDFIVASVYAETTTGGLSDAMVASHSHDSHHHHQDWQYITGTIAAPDNVTKARGWIQQNGTSGFGTVEVANFIITREPSGVQILDEILISANITTAVNNGTTTIDGSNITTGSIYADKLNVNALAAITIKADQIISHSVGGEAFDISSFGDAGPNNTANIYGGVIEGAVIEGGFLVAMGDYEYTNSFYNTQPSCSFAEDVAGKWRYPKQFGYTLSNAGHASIVSAGTYEYDFYAWNHCSNTLRRLTSPTGALTISAQTGMLTASGNQSCSCSRSSDKTWTISANIHGVTATLTIRVHVGFNSSDGYGTIYIDGTSVQHDSHWNGASGSHTGSKIINNVPLNYSISWSADDYQGGWWSINGYYSYNVRVDVDESVRNITLDGNDTISFTTTGGSMKIPPATMALT